MTLATQIACVESGGTAHLVQSVDPEAPLEPGDVAVYRCADCLERFDVVVEEDDLDAD
jgi:hypothetical protein